MIELNDLLGSVSCNAPEFELTSEEHGALSFLSKEIDEELFKSFLFKEGNIKILLFDIETSVSDRDEVKLVGVLSYPELKIYHFDHRLTRADLEGLIGAADTVIFAAFNYGFDLVRSFAPDAKEILLRRRTKFGDQDVYYYVLRKEGVVGYALDIQRISNNLINDKKRSLADLSESNEYFKKQRTDDFLDRKYNAYDLLAEFELLVRAQKKAKLMLEKIEFKDTELIDFITKQSRNEPIESHISRIKLFESGSRLAKALVAPFAKFPSMPAFFAGGRVCAFKVGNMKDDWSYYDINSEYPSIISRMSPYTMELCFGEEAVKIANQIKQDLLNSRSVEAFQKYYVDQESPALLLSSWVLVEFTRDAVLRVEALREKSKKKLKLSEHTLIYRNKRQEQTREEGYAPFKKGSVVNLPLYFLFIQKPEDVRSFRILDASGFRISRDEGWQRRWESLYQMRADSPELKTALKVALNATYGLTVDVDQPFSNIMLGAHITSFSRTVSYIVENELDGRLLYTDTDGFIATADAEEKLDALLQKLAPFGAKKEYPDGEQLILFRTKRYAIRSGDSWQVKGAEKLGGREKNKILSSLNGSMRNPVLEIRQITKKSRTPNLPAVRQLLSDSETGEWCYYLSYPADDISPDLRVNRRAPDDSGDVPAEIIYEETKSGQGYFACKVRKPLEDLASLLQPLPPVEMEFVPSNTNRGIPDDVFRPVLGNVDTTFLEGHVSLASLLHLPMKTQDKMRLMAKTIAAIGNSDNRGVKIAVETLAVEKGEIREIEPELKALPRRSRKKSPFAQRRFYIRQRFPYEITYHLSQDALDNSQYKGRKLVLKHVPIWTLGQMARIVDTFLEDLKLLENRFNEVLKDEIEKSDNRVLAAFYGNLKVKLVPYARYTRFDLSLDIPQSDATRYIETMENLCKRQETDYHKGLGYIGIRGKDISDSSYFMPANIVIYDRNARFNKHKMTFSRKFRPIVERWNNDKVGRVEIQTFAHKSNNRKTNPLASVLNAMEILKIKAPGIFDLLMEIFQNCLSVITHMFPDPPAGSGPAGQNSPCPTRPYPKEAKIIPILGGFVPWNAT